jgi:hypothetical protein
MEGDDQLSNNTSTLGFILFICPCLGPLLFLISFFSPLHPLPVSLSIPPPRKETLEGVCVSNKKNVNTNLGDFTC